MTWCQPSLVYGSAWVSCDRLHPYLPLNSQPLPLGGAAGLTPPELLLRPGRSRWRCPRRGVSSSHSGTVLPPDRLRRCRETSVVVTAGGGGAVGISWRAAPGGWRALRQQSINPQNHQWCWDGESPVSVCHVISVLDRDISSPTAVLRLPSLCVPAVLTASLGSEGSLSD